MQLDFFKFNGKNNLSIMPELKADTWHALYKSTAETVWDDCMPALEFLHNFYGKFYEDRHIPLKKLSKSAFKDTWGLKQSWP